MATKSFDAQKLELDEASADLRLFTLARPGCTEKVGILAIARVNTLCERMKTLFSAGPHAAALALIANSVRGRVLAAEARLAVLARKATVVR